MKRAASTTNFRHKLVALVVLALAMLVACASDPQPANEDDAEPAPTTPDIWGFYEAKIPLKDFSDVPGETIPAYAGKWLIELDVEGSFYLFDHTGYGRTSGDLAVAGDRITFDDPPAPEGAFICFVNGERTFEEGLGTYSFEAGDDEIAIAAEDEPCPLRKAILERTWTKV